MMKNWENNVTGEIGLVTPTPALLGPNRSLVVPVRIEH